MPSSRMSSSKLSCITKANRDSEQHKSEEEMLQKQIEQIQIKKSVRYQYAHILIYFISLILVVFVGVHGFETYDQLMMEEYNEKEQSISCLLKWKNSECSPMRMTDECNQLIQCIQNANLQLNQWQLLISVINKVAKTLSQLMIGPFILVILFIILLQTKQNGRMSYHQQ